MKSKKTKCSNTLSGKHLFETTGYIIKRFIQDGHSMIVSHSQCVYCNFVDDINEITEREYSDSEEQEAKEKKEQIQRLERSSWWEKLSWGD